MITIIFNDGEKREFDKEKYVCLGDGWLNFVIKESGDKGSVMKIPVTSIKYILFD